MFHVTRTVASATKFARKVVKSDAKHKIDITKGSDCLKDAYEAIMKTRRPYSRNIFKRAVYWIQDFVSNYKQLKSEIKEISSKKNLKKVLTEARATIKEYSDELKELINAGKAKAADKAGKKATKK